MFRFSCLLLTLLVPVASFAQRSPSASGPANVVLVTVRVLSATDPADRFEITEARVATGMAIRTPSPEPELASLQAGSPQLLILDESGAVLHRQLFTWTRVLTVPPAAPGTTNDGSPNFIVLPQPEVTLVLPYPRGAARVEVVPAAGREVATRAIGPSIDAPSARPLPDQASVAATPGALNVLLIASGFSPARIGLFPGLAGAIQSQLLDAEPFRANASSVIFRSAQATTGLGCSPGCAGIDRLMCCNSAQVISAAVGSGLPFDEIVVVHDTATYSGGGGRDVGGYRTNSYNTYTVTYNGQWTRQMVQHEFGHSFGNLCDEYTYGSEPYTYSTCANCRPTCSELSPFGPCLPSCDAEPSFFRPEPSIMLDFAYPTFNRASINTTTPVDGLATRLDYFVGTGTVPAAPTGLQAHTTTNSVTLSWNPSVGALSYRLMVGSASGLSNLFHDSVGSATSLSAPVPNGTYFWRLVAVNSAGWSPPSAEAQFTIGGPITTPGVPTTLQASVNGNRVTVSWNAATDQSQSAATSYRVQVGTIPGHSNLFNSAVGNLTTVSGTVGNGTYYWRVIASNSAGSSPPSVESQFTVGCAGPPGSPQDFAYSLLGRAVTLTWVAGATGSAATQYLIEAGSSSGSANLASIPTGSSAPTLVAQAPPGTFFVRVRAQNACGVSGPSNEQLIIVP